jgi:hypothetical protein
VTTTAGARNPSLAAHSKGCLELVKRSFDSATLCLIGRHALPSGNTIKSPSVAAADECNIDCLCTNASSHQLAFLSRQYSETFRSSVGSAGFASLEPSDMILRLDDHRLSVVIETKTPEGNSNPFSHRPNSFHAQANPFFRKQRDAQFALAKQPSNNSS